MESLLHIINDILDYSKITSNNLALEAVPFDLHQVLERRPLRCCGPRPTAKGIELVFDYPEDAPRHFLGDPTRIRQIAFNLVGNAIKFTERGQVRIDLPAPAARTAGATSSC